MRTRARVDENHGDIIRGARLGGCSVWDTSRLGHGGPDIVVGFRGLNYMFEIKNELAVPSARRLTLEELEFHQGWRGQIQVVSSITQIFQVLGLERP